MPVLRDHAVVIFRNFTIAIGWIPVQIKAEGFADINHEEVFYTDLFQRVLADLMRKPQEVLS